MDVEGKFVITWQSSGQDGSGWGVYAQQFNRDGSRVGLLNETQLLSFNGIALATYTLDYDGTAIGPISYDSSDMTQSAQNLVNAFASAGITIVANRVSAKEISVTFSGDDGAMNHPSLLVGTVTVTDGDPWAEVAAQTLSNGQSGEFRVNVQTSNDQAVPRSSDEFTRRLRHYVDRLGFERRRGEGYGRSRSRIPMDRRRYGQVGIFGRCRVRRERHDRGQPEVVFDCHGRQRRFRHFLDSFSGESKRRQLYSGVRRRTGRVCETLRVGRRVSFTDRIRCRIRR